MTTSHRRTAAAFWLATFLLAIGASSHAQQHAHTHGRLALDVAVDASSITLQMEAPLDNFLGFERAPRTDAERRQVATMVARLKAADTLFVPDPKAGCTLSQVKLDSAVLALGEHAEPAAAATTGKDAQEHADIDIDITFTCTKADAARFVEVRLFDVFKAIRAIDAQVASSQGQFKRSLSKKASTLRWGQ
mgnify:CR=1 FL=1